MAKPVDVEFVVDAPMDEIFAYSGDLEALGYLVPGVNLVEMSDDPRQAQWHLQLKLGLIKVNQNLKTSITELIPPDKAQFSCESNEMAMVGSVELEPKDGSPDVTVVRAHFEAEGRGPMARMVDMYLEPKLKEYASGFADNLQAKLVV